MLVMDSSCGRIVGPEMHKAEVKKFKVTSSCAYIFKSNMTFKRIYYLFKANNITRKIYRDSVTQSAGNKKKVLRQHTYLKWEQIAKFCWHIFLVEYKENLLA